MNDGQKIEARSFGWRDFLFIQRLQAHGQVLDYERAQVDGVSPMRDALRDYVLLGTGSLQTLVLSDQSAFAQYVRYDKSEQVRLTYLAPAPTHEDDVGRWIDLLEQLAAKVGAQGAHHIVAEAQDDGEEITLLRRAGFGVFTRQMLFRLASPATLVKDLLPLPGLRPWQSTDNWGVRLLYANTVPHLAQQIEAPIDEILNTSLWPHRLVLERDGQIIACIATRRGRVGNGIRLLLHPEADAHVEALIGHGVAALADAPSLPVYCRVRRYESWLRAPLEACSFEPTFRTVLLVKHTVARVMTPEWQRLPAIEGRAEMTTPLAQTRLGKSLES